MERPASASLSFGTWVMVVLVAAVVAGVAAVAVLVVASGEMSLPFPAPKTPVPAVPFEPPSTTSPADDAAIFETVYRAKVLFDAVERFKMMTDDRLPESLSELNAGPADWDEKSYGAWKRLLTESPDALTDGWGRQFIYEITDAEIGEFRIVSFGRDGLPGGSGADEDILYPPLTESEPH